MTFLTGSWSLAQTSPFTGILFKSRVSCMGIHFISRILVVVMVLASQTSFLLLVLSSFLLIPFVLQFFPLWYMILGVSLPRTFFTDPLSLSDFFEVLSALNL